LKGIAGTPGGPAPPEEKDFIERMASTFHKLNKWFGVTG